MRGLLAATSVWMVACGGSSAGGDAAPTADAGPPPVDAAPPTPDAAAFDCEQLPVGPLAVTEYGQAHPVEDLAFDFSGHLFWSDGQHLYRSDLAGTHEVFAANLSAREGMRFLPSGDLMVADRDGGALLRIDPTGARHTVKSGLDFPDGLEIGRDGMVYLTDLSAGKVYRIDPMTGASSVLVDGEIEAPNGLTFNPDYTMLYLGGVAGNATIWRLPIAPDGTPGELEVFITGVGSGEYDGIEFDACGNLYICDLAEGRVYRVHPDKSVEVLVDRAAQQAYMPNLQWGRGVGGWDDQTIHVIDLDVGLLEVDIGVPGKPR